MHNWPKVCCQIWPNAAMARAICKTLWLPVRVRVQHVGSFCFRAINTFEQPQLESQTSPTVNGLCYQLCKVPATNSNCGQAPHLAPSLANELLLNNCANFQFMFLLVMVATPTRQQAGWQSIRIDSFIDFCNFFVLFAFSASAGTQPARQAGSQAVRLRIRHVAPSTETDNYRLAVEMQLQLPEMCGPTHARTHTHTCTLMAMFI